MNTTKTHLKLDGLTYVSGAFQYAYDAKKAEGWTPAGTVVVSNLHGPNTLHVFLSDDADVQTLEAIIATADRNEPVLKRQRARDARQQRELRKTLAKIAGK